MPIGKPAWRHTLRLYPQTFGSPLSWDMRNLLAKHKLNGMLKLHDVGEMVYVKVPQTKRCCDAIHLLSISFSIAYISSTHSIQNMMICPSGEGLHTFRPGQIKQVEEFTLVTLLLQQWVKRDDQGRQRSSCMLRLFQITQIIIRTEMSLERRCN